MEQTDGREHARRYNGPFELSPYPSTIVNRSALPESWFFWRRWPRRRAERKTAPS